ncbi:MAG: NusG domain II-containing protein [Oscillospiraceae bacterium]|nr:NusG domain II-containing protein [Oscillospiraceae bacterium]
MRGKTNRFPGVTGWDVALAVVFLAVAALIWVLLLRPHTVASKAEIKLNGVLIGTYELSEDSEFTVTNGDHANTVVISDGEIYVKSANCPDQYCVKHAAVKHSGECIVCLPAKLVITVTGGEEAPVDAYTG